MTSKWKSNFWEEFSQKCPKIENSTAENDPLPIIHVPIILQYMLSLISYHDAQAPFVTWNLFDMFSTKANGYHEMNYILPYNVSGILGT